MISKTDGFQQLKPTFIQPTSDRLELLPGDSSTLICEVHREVDPENPPRYGLLIWWCNSTRPECHEEEQSMNTRNPIFLHVDKSVAQNASDLRSEFSLTNVEASQADMYYCVAFSEDRDVSKCPGSVAVDIVIKDKSRVRLTDHTKLIDILEGNPFNLTCIADGYPSPTFKWKKDEKAINGGKEGTIRKLMAEESDAGIYKCQAQNKFETSAWSPDIKVEVDSTGPSGLSKVTLALLIAAAVVLAVLLVFIIIRLSKLRSQMTCFTIERISIRGDNNVVHRHSEQRRGSRLSRADSSHERQTFLHDVFIHNHSSDSQFADMIRSKLQNQESHLKVGLWSEVERPDRSSTRNKLLRLRLLNSTRIVIVASEAYLKHDYHALTSALAKSRAKPESLRSKVIVVRVIEEPHIPKDLVKDVLASLEYNVDSDSCYFWPRFLKVAMPDQKELLYWV
ncbi:uncharacterized protein LOC119723380 isoform X2 [Patiria miniata]|uniref:Ig-like domain-containing protein n=1 Tax=Patiria miniata TaxID=46514 RepID=A0A913ZDR5_PATMI|nr:uncharacterized protein LOC119723380 isoform X2 [Patiria miniata]